MANVPVLGEIVTNKGGTFWTFTDDTADIAFNFRFDTDDEWLSGQAASVRVFADELLPSIDVNGLTTAGTWLGGIILGAILTTIGGSKIEWDGDGTFIVETSINNGSTWSAATNGRQITGLTAGTASGTKSLQVRIRFLAGESEDTITKVRSLSLKLYRSRASKGSSSLRTATFSGSISLASNAYQPIEENTNAGLNLYSGYATIPGGEDSRTIESWVYLQNAPGASGYLYDARTGASSRLYWTGTAWAGDAGTTYYVNGLPTAAGSISLLSGHWYHIVAVLPAVTTGNIILGADNTGASQLPVRLGMFATYPTALSAAQIQDLYNSYLGISILSVADTSALDVEDDAEPVKAYSYEWSITGSG